MFLPRDTISGSKRPALFCGGKENITGPNHRANIAPLHLGFVVFPRKAIGGGSKQTILPANNKNSITKSNALPTCVFVFLPSHLGDGNFFCFRIEDERRAIIPRPHDNSIARDGATNPMGFRRHFSSSHHRPFFSIRSFVNLPTKGDRIQIIV